ncbi:MAG: PQQ-binding-like beta-propeller repeat protein [Pirellulaceae bacterium]|nr:PQQ-binding-like beta-propeller repeat protein [Pirellulaceae bacterium]
MFTINCIRSIVLMCAIGVWLCSALRVAADDWPQWRGPNRDNRSTETGLLNSWPENGPRLVWRLDGLGDGIASLAIADGRIFTTTTHGNAEYAVALDEHTGETRWTTEVSAATKENPLMRWLSQRTPTVDGNRIYAFTNTGWLVCLDRNSGAVKWQTNYPSEFGTKQGKWGFCDRPLIDGEKLICTPGGSKATVVALNKHTGKQLWSELLENREPFSYAAPLQIETDGLKQYVAFLKNGLVSFAADDGRVLWRYDKIANSIANNYTPLALKDGLLCANGYSRSVSRLKLVRHEDQVSCEELYFHTAVLDPFEDNAILVDGHMYSCSSNGQLACFEIDSGKSVWTAILGAGPVGGNRGSGRGKAAVTYAEGHLYFRRADGTVSLVEANPKAYVEKSFFKLDEPRNGIGSTFPVIASGCLYLRDNDRLYKYDISQDTGNTVAVEPRLVTMAKPVESKRPPLPTGERVPHAIFVPTPMDVVAKMLEVAKVGKDDLVVDLGSGDGRILIEAAKKYGCRGIGIEIDPELVELSKQRIHDTKLNTLVTITKADLFEADFGDATVVTAYLYPELLKRLLPKLEKLKPGSRIVTHQFAIPGISPEETVRTVSQETGAEHTIYLWTTPLLKSPKKD